MANVYNRGKTLIGSNIMVSGITLRCMLMKSYTYDRDHVDVADIDGAGAEISGSGYSRQPLVNAAWVEDQVNDRAELRSDEVSFGSIAIGETVTSLVVFEQANGSGDVAANDGLICYIELTDTPTNGQPFSVRFNGAATAGAVLRLNDS